MQWLVLWDIDRTLITGPGFGREIYAAAFRAALGRELEHLPDPGGRTDHDLTVAALTAHGIPVTDETVAALYQALIVATRQRREEMRVRGSALPGAAQALAALAKLPGVVQSLVTGNLRDTAWEKLVAFDLTHGIDFEVGGYGADDAVRATLVRLARERAAAKYGVTLPDDRVVVIGDTPFDIIGARRNGVVAIGVATGRSSAADLAAAGAHLVLPSLADTDAVLRAVLGEAAPFSDSPPRR